MVRRGRVFRSDAVLDPDAAEQRMLRAAGIVLVCDLRGATERLHAPNRWWADEGVERLDLDIMADIRGAASAWALIGQHPGPEGGRALMQSIYREMPAAAAGHLRTIFGCIARGQTPLLIHCTAGKDRTGFVSAMVLHALGVARDVILADYLSSGGLANPAVRTATRRLIAENAPDADECAVDAIIGVKSEYLESSFEAIAQAHGSIDNYLACACGLDPTMRTSLLTALLEPT